MWPLEWAAAAGVRNGSVLDLSWDNPDAVSPESPRSDACIELLADASPPPDISIDTLAAGRYMVYTHRGSYDGIPDAYRNLFQQWLPESGEEMDVRPCMEVYFNSPYDTPADELMTDLCLPLVPTRQD